MSATRDERIASEALARHWDAAYDAHGVDASWHQSEPVVSLALLDAMDVGPGARVVDVGGGGSLLADRLVERGAAAVTVLDASQVALDLVRARLSGDAAHVELVHADVLRWEPGRTFDVWHDRAVFHFLVDEDDRTLYRRTLEATVADGGIIVVGAFADDGPPTCSGLPVERYRPVDLAAALGPGFELVEARREVHRTPRGTPQPFAWVAGRLRHRPPPRSLDDLVARARARIARYGPLEAQDAAGRGAVIVDIRSAFDRERDGIVPGSIHIPRTVLEWRLAPDGPWRTPHVAPDDDVILLCDHGCSSALAAANLVELGFATAADVVGGFEAWRAAGLPVARPRSHELAPGELVGMRPAEW